jgi:integrase
MRRAFSHGRSIANLLNLVLKSALKQRLLRTNPVSLVDRPREARRRWTILSPTEIAAVDKASQELIGGAEGEERQWRQQARVIFLTGIGAGLRRGEILGLHWRDVSLADPMGPTLTIRETWVRNGPDTPSPRPGSAQSQSVTGWPRSYSIIGLAPTTRARTSACSALRLRERHSM